MGKFTNRDQLDLAVSPIDFDSNRLTVPHTVTTSTSELPVVEFGCVKFYLDDCVPPGEVWSYKPDGSFGPIAKEIKP